MRGNLVRVGSAIAIVLVSAFAALIALHYVQPKPVLALSSIAGCFSAATTSEATFPTQCLTTTISQLLETYPTQEILAYTIASTTPQSVTNVCHPIGHIIGEQTYAKYDSISQALAECTSACRSACTHGVIGAGVLQQLGEQSSGEDAAQELMNIAQDSLTQLISIATKYCSEGNQICHGIGHVAFISTQNLTSALGICDKAANGVELRESCYEGVFMERAGSYSNALFPAPDHELPETKAGEYSYPCASLSPQYRLACYIFLTSYQAPLFQEDGLSTPQAKLTKAEQVCESLSQPDRSYCFAGIGTSNSVFGVQTSNQKSVDSFCGQFPTASDQNACMIGIIPAFSYSQYHGLYAYCESRPTESQRSTCYNASFEYLTMNTQYADPQTVCNGFAACLPRYGQFLQEKATLPNYFNESGFASFVNQ